jgi:dTMP kinase
MNTYSGNFISIEGVDGAGKGTVIEELRNEFEGFEYTHEPSNGKYGRIIREELKTDSDPTVSDFFLFCADRFDHCNSLIGPKLDQGKNVLTDRYNLSTFAYQSKVIDEQMDVVNPFEYIDRIVGQFIIEPDLTILIDVPIEESFDRLDDEKEKYEEYDRQKDIRRIYRFFADRKDYVEVVDGTQDIEEVTDECIKLINENIN